MSTSPYVTGPTDPTTGQLLDPRDPKARIAASMMQAGSSMAPAASWTDGMARVAEAMMGGHLAAQARQRAAAAAPPAANSPMGMYALGTIY